MKKLLLILPLLLLFGCEKPAEELTFEQKKAKTEESVIKHFKGLGDDKYDNVVYEFSEFKIINRTQQDYENLEFCTISRPGCGIGRKNLENYTEENYEIYVVRKHNTTNPYTYYVSSDFKIITYHGATFIGCGLCWE